MRYRSWRNTASAGACAIALMFVSGCSNFMEEDSGVQPTAGERQTSSDMRGAKPDSGNQAILDALQAMNVQPIHTLSLAEARKQPSFADGVRQVARQTGAASAPMQNTLATRDIRLAGAAGQIPARIYTPVNLAGPLPVIVYFHGGGWVLADLNVYDASARALAQQAQAIVVSVEYRKAPEHKFPAQHEDAFAAYQWIVQNASSFGGDSARIAIAGESAGGNLAVATALAARDRGVRAPLHVLSIYPIAGIDLDTASYRENANAKPLDRATMEWFFRQAARPQDMADPRINLVNADLRAVPPLTIILAEIDPLRSEGEALAQRAREAGVRVESRVWTGATHEFFGADAVMSDAREAQAWAGEKLRTALARR